MDGSESGQFLELMVRPPPLEPHVNLSALGTPHQRIGRWNPMSTYRPLELSFGALELSFGFG